MEGPHLATPRAGALHVGRPAVACTRWRRPPARRHRRGSTVAASAHAAPAAPVKLVAHTELGFCRAPNLSCSSPLSFDSAIAARARRDTRARRRPARGRRRAQGPGVCGVRCVPRRGRVKSGMWKSKSARRGNSRRAQSLIRRVTMKTVKYAEPTTAARSCRLGVPGRRQHAWVFLRAGGKHTVAASDPGAHASRAARRQTSGRAA